MDNIALAESIPVIRAAFESNDDVSDSSCC
jgi:hypothetical protein